MNTNTEQPETLTLASAWYAWDERRFRPSSIGVGDPGGGVDAQRPARHSTVLWMDKGVRGALLLYCTAVRYTYSDTQRAPA